MYSTSYYARSAAAIVWIPIVALILAIAGTVLAYIFIMPKNKVKNLNKFWYFIHNMFHFKTLLVEKIFKALYVYTTLFCIAAGFFMLFTNFFTGLVLMVLGPVAVRITFEMVMMFIMLVQNTSDLRNKLCDDESDMRPADAPVIEKQPPKEYVFCSSCGTRYNKLDGRCPGAAHAGAVSRAALCPGLRPDRQLFPLRPASGQHLWSKRRRTAELCPGASPVSDPAGLMPARFHNALAPKGVF